MSVLKASQNGRYQWLKDFLFSYSAEESECDAPDVLIWVLQVVPEVLTDQDLHALKHNSQFVGLLMLLYITS